MGRISSEQEQCQDNRNHNKLIHNGSRNNFPNTQVLDSNLNVQNQEVSGNLHVFLPLTNSTLEDIGEEKMQAQDHQTCDRQNHQSICLSTSSQNNLEWFRYPLQSESSDWNKYLDLVH